MAKSPLLRKLSRLAAAVEAVPGTAEVLDATDAVDMISNLSLEYLTQKPDVERPESMGTAKGVPDLRTARVRFRLGLSAESTSPRCAEVFLAGCGLASAGAGVYSRTTMLPHEYGAQNHTLTLGFYLDGTRNLLYGAAGNAVIHGLAGQPTYADFDFQGKHTVPADLALPGGTDNKPTLLRFANSGLLIGSWAPRMSKADLDLGNQVAFLEDENADDESGIAFAYVDDFDTILGVDPEQCLVNDEDVYGKFWSGEEQAISLALKAGTASAAIAFSKGEFVNLKHGARRNLATFDMGIRDNLADLSITFATA